MFPYDLPRQRWFQGEKSITLTLSEIQGRDLPMHPDLTLPRPSELSLGLEYLIGQYQQAQIVIRRDSVLPPIGLVK